MNFETLLREIYHIHPQIKITTQRAAQSETNIVMVRKIGGKNYRTFLIGEKKYLEKRWQKIQQTIRQEIQEKVVKEFNERIEDLENQILEMSEDD